MQNSSLKMGQTRAQWTSNALTFSGKVCSLFDACRVDGDKKVVVTFNDVLHTKEVLCVMAGIGTLSGQEQSMKATVSYPAGEKPLTAITLFLDTDGAAKKVACAVHQFVGEMAASGRRTAPARMLDRSYRNKWSKQPKIGHDR